MISTPSTNNPTTDIATTTSVVFDAAADFYDATRGFPAAVSEQVGEAMADAIGERNARVLEIGVGTGRIALPLVRRGFCLTGIDLSSPMLSKFQEKLRGEAADCASRLALVRGDATQLPFPEATFDAVVEVHVLHLVPDWRRALDEMRRVLRPVNGVLLHGHSAGQHGSSDARTPWNEVRTRWRGILDEMEHHVDWIGAKSDEELLDAMRAEAREFKQLPRVEWISTDSYARAFDMLAKRFFSDTWRVPEEIFTESVERLRAELKRKHPRPDETCEVEHAFHLSAARF